MFEFQASLIFPAHAVARAGPLPPRAELLSLETPDGHKLVGVHIPADRRAPAKPLILGFGGNGWNGQDVAEYLHRVYPDHAVVAFQKVNRIGRDGVVGPVTRKALERPRAPRPRSRRAG